MKFWERLLHFFSKKDNFQIIPEDPNKTFSDNKERLIFTEQKSRSADESILTQIPKEEIELMEQEILAQRSLKIPQKYPADVITQIQDEERSISPNNLISLDVFPKKCKNCPDHKNYFKGEIHQCPDCGEWICGRHYHGHIMKYHKSTQYTISGSDSGSGTYKFKK